MCFLFEPRCFPFSPLGASCDVGVPCMPSASLLSGGFQWLCLSSVCGAPSFFCPGFPVISLVLPLSLLIVDLFLSPRSPFRSLSRPFFALPHGRLLYCLVFLFGSFFLFCALASGPPGVSPVTASSTVGRPASLSSVVAAASSSSWFSPLAIVLLCCSPLGVVSLGSCSAGESCHLILLPVFNLYSMMVPSLTAGSEYPSGGEGLLALCRFVAFFFVEGFREWHFDAQWSPGLANSL